MKVCIQILIFTVINLSTTDVQWDATESMTLLNMTSVCSLTASPGSRGSFNFGGSDALVNWAVSNGKLIRGHTLGEVKTPLLKFTVQLIIVDSLALSAPWMGIKHR